jgi:uncharacterized protein
MYETRIILREAIRNQRPVVGLGAGLRREFCPHLLGHNGGVWRTLVWQYAGLSESGLREGGDWRCFELDDLADLHIRNGEWRRGWVASVEAMSGHVDTIDTEVDAAFGPEVRGRFMSGLRFGGLGFFASR